MGQQLVVYSIRNQRSNLNKAGFENMGSGCPSILSFYTLQRHSKQSQGPITYLDRPRSALPQFEPEFFAWNEPVSFVWEQFDVQGQVGPGPK